MIVVVSGERSILGTDDAEVAALNSPVAADWLSQVHPDDRPAARHALDRCGANHVEIVVIRVWWPRIGHRPTRCAAVTIDDFVLLELCALDQADAHPYQEMEAVIVAAACPEQDEPFGEKLDPIYRSMLVGMLRTHLPGFHMNRGAGVTILSHDRPCTDVIPLHPYLRRRARFEAHIGSRRVEVVGQVTAVSLRHHAIEYRTDAGPAVILPRSNRS